ncbi:MAG: signal peptidase I, partial [Bacillota bacterium]
NEKQKKILNIVVTSVQIAVVLLAIVVSAIIIANPNVANAEVGGGKTKLLPVLTDSMNGDQEDSFAKGDLVVAKEPDDPTNLEVGDIVTYKFELGNTMQLNTHRIIEKDVDTAGNIWFRTKGDNEPEDPGFIYADEVIAVYQYHLNGVGSAIHWLQRPTNFLLVIVLPLILLFIYNIILFVRMITQARLEKAAAEKGSVDEEEIKKKAIEEYLASKKADEKPAAKKTTPQKKEKPEASKDQK